jgi:hypothetical protein
MHGVYVIKMYGRAYFNFFFKRSSFPQNIYLKYYLMDTKKSLFKSLLLVFAFETIYTMQISYFFLIMMTMY